MSLKEYLHEKAKESRHNETIAYLIIILGAVFLMGGTLVTAVTTENPSWFFFIPYRRTDDPFSLLGLAYALIAVVLLCLGVALAVHSALERSGYMEEMRKAQTQEGERMRRGRRRLQKLLTTTDQTK